jgi:hypothetical protein
MKNDYEVRGDKAVIFVRRNERVLEFIIDAEDLEKTKKFPYRWSVKSATKEGRFYVSTSDTENGIHHIYLHRFVIGAPKGSIVDHINNNTLDNRKNNLRIVTKSENGQNRKGVSKINTSGIRGVGWNKFAGKWSAYCSENGKKKHLGYFEKVEDAEKTAIEWRKKNMPFSEMDK